MTSNIVVFQPPTYKDVISNKTEKEILYEKFEKQSNIPMYHFRLFMEMENQHIIPVKTTIPSILIKKILPYVIPIIKEIPEFTVKKKTVDFFNRNLNTHTRIDKYYNISLQLNYPVKCKLQKSGALVTIPSNQSFFIFGLHIPNIISKSIDYTFPNYMLSIDIMEILKSGKFGLMEFQSNTFTQERLNDISSKIHIKNDIYFTDDENSIKQINTINKYIEFVNNYYKNNYLMVYKYLEQSRFKNYIKNEIKRYNIFNFDTKSQNFIKSSPAIQLMEKMTDSKIVGNEFTVNFILSFLNVTDIYNKIKILGINHPNIKKIYYTIDQQNASGKIISDYKKKKFKKMLEYAKKKSISINKFNINALHKLTEIQRKIINLEFEKIEKFYASRSKHELDFNLVNKLGYAIDNDKTILIKASR
jgi:hypothetical protein